MEMALEVNNLCKQYQGFSLKNISFSLPKGAIMGFVGENGAGKSTTIKLILDLIKKETGEVNIYGNNKMEKSMKEQIGVVLDEACFPDELNVKEIDYVMNKIYHTWDKKAFTQWKERFGLPDKKKVKEYSKGMKMKLSIAVALSHGSKLLILDEATSGLDPIVREEILEVFQEFIQNEEHAVFISSHIISDLEKICDYITFIHKGQILFTKEKDSLIEDYGILKCSKEEFQQLNKNMWINYRENQFGVEALVEKKKVQKGYMLDKATIEDIMLFLAKK